MINKNSKCQDSHRKCDVLKVLNHVGSFATNFKATLNAVRNNLNTCLLKNSFYKTQNNKILLLNLVKSRFMHD